MPELRLAHRPQRQLAHLVCLACPRAYCSVAECCQSNHHNPPIAPTIHQTFLELIKLYKSVLARKRKESQEAIDRLENGLNKLHKTQVSGLYREAY